MPSTSRLVLLSALPFLLASLPAAAGVGIPTPIGPDGYGRAGLLEVVVPGSDSRRILARTRGELLLTEDGGANWQSLLRHWPGKRPIELDLDPVDASRWYVGIFDDFRDESDVWQTDDSGKTWAPLHIPGGIDPTYFPYREIWVDRLAPGTIVQQFRRGVIDQETFFSRDRGRTWSVFPYPDHLAFLSIAGVGGGILWTRGGRYRLDDLAYLPSDLPSFFDAFALDHERAETAFLLSDSGFYKTTDGGASYRRALFRYGMERFAQSSLHPEHLALTFSTKPYLLLSRDRGETWSPDDTPEPVIDPAFDPATGELLATRPSGLARRRLDGTWTAATTPRGLSSMGVETVAFTGGQAWAVAGGAVYVRDAAAAWQKRGTLPNEYCTLRVTLVMAPSEPRKGIAFCERGTYTTQDGGWTWQETSQNGSSDEHPYEPQIAMTGESPVPTTYLLSGERLLRSTDLGATWHHLEGKAPEVIAVHPDASRGVVGVETGGAVVRYRPATGWEQLATLPVLDVADPNAQIGFGYEPAHPELIYAIFSDTVSRSDDFGQTWELVERASATFGHENFLADWPRIVIDPFDRQHFLVLGYETRDGGRTARSLPAGSGRFAAFDPEVPGRFWLTTTGNGVLESTAAVPSCPGSDAAFCARDGRYLLTVDWRDPLGQTGKGTSVLTGSEDSGLFYFFDVNNWELLVKVLNGCGLNQRQWVFAAGTTNVEYSLRVEDRLTGQIRHYGNTAGQAAPALTDTDAFSGCDATPPPPLPSAERVAGEPVLPLVDGKFEVAVRWTDFAGQQGDGLTTPLRSANSGLFYFFTPDNWELLVKVLDGCAINGHYWVLGAATTNVGYRLEVAETTSNPRRTKVYTNPLGRAAPALIDIEAFTCP